MLCWFERNVNMSFNYALSDGNNFIKVPKIQCKGISIEQSHIEIGSLNWFFCSMWVKPSKVKRSREGKSGFVKNIGHGLQSIFVGDFGDVDQQVPIRT